jgi:endo-1,3-1,4-beta-glycanase ExoK
VFIMANMKYLTVLFLVIALLLIGGSVPVAAQTQPTNGHPVGGAFVDNLDRYNRTLWDKSDGWTNGDPFNVGWRAANVNFASGQMSLMLDNAGCPATCSTRPYASGEYRTDKWYGYGKIEARFKAPKVNGTVAASLFTYAGPYDGDPWDEIDIEILGKNTTQMQTNYFTNGVGGHETLINLGFDASAAFHTYAFEWRPTYIKWYVDGILVLTENGSRGPLPTSVGKIMVNYWAGIGVDAWLGTYTYPGVPTYAVYDWIRYTP